MKKFLTVISILIFSIAMFACEKDNDPNAKGAITLPVAMSVDSTDGEVQIPFETEGDAEAIVWTSADEDIATVNALGQITAKNNGTVTITAKSGSFETTMKLVASLDKYANYTKIKTKLEFLFLFSNPDNFNSPDQLYALDNDLDFNGDMISPIGGWDTSDENTPVDPNKQFRATLDGRGYALKNFQIINPLSTKVGTSYFGVSLIPFIYDGKVLNLNIIDAIFSGTGFTGSIAGKIEKGVIDNCFVRAKIISTSGNTGIPSGGIAGIIGPEAIVRNVLLDAEISGGFIYSGFNFGNGSNSNAISASLGDEDRRRPIRTTAITTNKGDLEEDAALRDFIDSKRILDEELGDFGAYSMTEQAKMTAWAIKTGYMPFLIRKDGLTPSWAMIPETD
jgi:hypothetical protein